MRHRVRFGVVFWMTCVFVVALGNSKAAAQSPEKRSTGGTISGVVTRDGKPAAGVGVLLVERSDRGWGPGDRVERTRSDKAGKFTFEGLEQGSYGLDAFQPGAFIRDPTPWDGPVLITLSDGESVEGVKLELERGGVITGRVVDEESRPVAGEYVQLFVEKPSDDGTPSMADLETREYTDDRGVYRIYGLSPGQYAVGAGERKDEPSYGGSGRLPYEQSFHGGSSIPEGAKRIAVASGTETRDVDVVVRRGSPGFTISGKVIDVETRAPVTNVRVGYAPIVNGQPRGFAVGGGVRDDGSFVDTGMKPGVYHVVAIRTQEQSASSYCDPVEITVVDRNLKDLVLEMHRAASIRGVIVPLELDRNADISAVKNSSMILQYEAEPGSKAIAWGNGSAFVRIKPDLTFESTGLRVGSYRPVLRSSSPVRGFYIARVEVDGIAFTGPISIPEIKDYANVRIVVGRTTSVLRGRVVLRNGTVPFDNVSVTLRVPGTTHTIVWTPVDSTGAFLVEGAPPGDFQAVAAVNSDDGSGATSAPVSVTIGREGSVEVNIELDLSSKPTAGGGQ